MPIHVDTSCSLEKQDTFITDGTENVFVLEGTNDAEAMVSYRKKGFASQLRHLCHLFIAGLTAALAAGGCLLAVFLLLQLAYTNRADRVKADDVGKTPPVLTEALMASDAMAYGIDTGDGWLCRSHDETPAIIKYSYDGEIIWRREYAYELEYPYIDAVTPAADGGFVFVLDQGSASDVGYTRFASIIRCDREGREIWRTAFEDHMGLRFRSVFEWQGESFLAVGTWQNPNGHDSLDDVYLCTLSSEGSVVKEAHYGGSDFDRVRQAAIFDGCGVVLDISTQSKDGDFSASGDGYPVSVMAMFDGELNLQWYHVLDWDIYFEGGMIVKDNELYLAQYRYEGSGEERNRQMRLAKYAVTGEEIWVKNRKTRIYEEFDQDIYFLPNNENQVIFYDEGAAFYMNANGWITRILPNIPDIPERVLHIHGGTVVLSWRNPFAGEAIVDPDTFCVERIYSGYTEKGWLLWRTTQDVTSAYT